jgi:pimeloyl-ACP methyl ester carboxylesterase
MAVERFEVEVAGGRLCGEVAGGGEPVLVLHGGPALNWEYLRPLLDELEAGSRVAVYQQRGLAPSTVAGPHDVAAHVADALAVLDGLGWRQAAIVGHSWGGHLLLHLLAARPERVSAALVVDTLGGVCDGGEAAFDAELLRRTPAGDVALVEQLEARAMAGDADEDDLLASMRLLWPAYFADRAAAPPLPPLRFSPDAYAATFASLHAELPALAARLGGVAVPTLFVHGAGSPMPLTASSDSAEAIGPAAAVELVEGAGHFPWIERPGAVAAALDALQARASAAAP